MMMTYDVGLLLDGLILVFLCVTIFYAARLSLFMKTFREGRGEIGRLIKDLSVTIDKAEASVAVMKKNAGGTEEALRQVIGEAKFLSDELKFMTETGDNLASRLEKLAERNRELVDLMENNGGIGTQTIRPSIQPYEPKAEARVEPKAEPAPTSKATIDPETFQIDDEIESGMDDDDEYDFHALEDGAYRVEEGLAEDDFDAPDAPNDRHDDRGDDILERIFRKAELEKAKLLEAEGRLEDEPVHKPKIDTQAKSKVRSFAIFDRQYHEEEMDDDGEEMMSAPQTPVQKRQFHSKAEQDLYEALQRKKRALDEAGFSQEEDKSDDDRPAHLINRLS